MQEGTWVGPTMAMAGDRDEDVRHCPGAVRSCIRRTEIWCGGGPIPGGEATMVWADRCSTRETRAEGVVFQRRVRGTTGWRNKIMIGGRIVQDSRAAIPMPLEKIGLTWISHECPRARYLGKV